MRRENLSLKSITQSITKIKLKLFYPKNIDYEHLFQKSEEVFQKDWSKEDIILKDWISSRSKEEIIQLLEELKYRCNNDLWTDRFFQIIEERYPDALNDTDIKYAAIIIVNEIREYSKRTFFKGIPYEKALTRVHKRIGKKYKIKVPELASVISREDAIAKILFGEAIKKLSPEELESAFAGMVLDSDLKAEKKKEMMMQTLAAGGLQALSKMLGKNVIKKVVLAVIEKTIQKQIGEKATKQIVEKMVKQIPAQAMKRAFFWIGVALLAKDVWDLSGEASRITTPIIISISFSRTMDRLGSN